MSPRVAEGPFAHAKGVVEALYAALKAEPRFEPGEDPCLHPGKTARTSAGTVGELHPALLEGTWSAFELDLATLFAESRDPVEYVDVVSFPAVRQDLAFVVAEEVPAGDLVDAAREAAGPELRAMRAFDVYRGPQVGEGRKSVAFAVEFQSPERTLTDEDAAACATGSPTRCGALRGRAPDGLTRSSAARAGRRAPRARPA